LVGILGVRNEKRVENRVKNRKKLKKEELLAPTRRRRPLVTVDHRVGPPCRHPSPIGEEEEMLEREESKIEKREKDNGKMSKKGLTPYL